MSVSLISVSEARQVVLAHAPAPSIVDADPSDAIGRVLARPLHARFTVPATDVSVMDGWAVRAADLTTTAEHVSLRKLGESAAGHPFVGSITSGEAVRISTGAVIPKGADAVIAQEDGEENDDAVVIHRERLGSFAPGTFVRRAGSDVIEGDALLAAGTRLGPAEVAWLVVAGHPSIPIYRPPVVAVLCTGDELVSLGATPQIGQTVSTNGLMLAGQIRQAGGRALVLGDVADAADLLTNAIERGLSSDVLVTSGGISIGEHDLVAAALKALNVDLRFRGIAMRPGKPTTFGIAGERPVFALPGNPASSFVAFELLVRPVLRSMCGASPTPMMRRVVLATSAAGAGSREHWVRARLDGERAFVLPDQTSGNLRSIAGCDALIPVPAKVAALAAGEVVNALILEKHG